MTIRKRLIIGASVSIILAAFIGITGMVSLNKVNRVSREVVERNGLISAYCNQMEIAILQARRNEKNYLLRGDDKYLREVEKETERIKENLGYLRLKLDGEFKDRMEQIGSIVNQYYQEFFKVAADIKTDIPMPAKESFSDKPLFVTLSRKIEPLAEQIAVHARQEMKRGIKEITGIAEQSNKIVTITIGVTLFLLTSLAIILSHSITGPLHELIKGAEIISTGNLDHRIKQDKKKLLPKCREELNCDKKECPAYLASELRCWGIAETHCFRKESGATHADATMCYECPVYEKYRRVIGDEIAELTDVFNLMAGNLKKTTVLRDYVDNIIKSMIDTLIVVSSEARILTVNKVACELLGYQADELIGMPVEQIIAEEEEEEEEEELFKGAKFRKLIKNGSISDYDVIYRTRSGEMIPVSFSGSVMKDNQGNLLGIVGIGHDMRTRKKLQQRIENERDYVRHLIESSPDFQLTLNKDGNIMDVNAAFETLAGKSRVDIIGTSIYKYLPRKEIECLIAEILDKKKIRNIELSINEPEKRVLNYNFSGTVFTTPEGESGVYASGRDMTEVREKELQLIHAGRLASLGEVAAGVAHEINQPLSVISMAAEATLRDIEKNLFDVSGLSVDLEDIMRNVGRIDRIITHMRTFARKPEEWRRIEPEEALNNAFILLGEQFKMHGIIVSIKIEDNLPLIKVDVTQLEQVFVNILINAEQVLNERGEEAKKSGEDFEKKLVCGISRKKENEHEWVMFEFADNAYGVPDELKRKIFEPFFTTKEAGEGTGLGLSIAYGIVTRSLGGKILVEDNDMGGASFKVAVKVKKEDRAIED